MLGVTTGTVSQILTKWISVLYLSLRLTPLWSMWDQVERTLPEAFRQSYPSDTLVIVDATELRVEKPSSLPHQSQLSSYHKSHCTVKGLVGIAPSGAFIFISQLYTGSISDRQLVLESGLLPFLHSVQKGRM